MTHAFQSTGATSEVPSGRFPYSVLGSTSLVVCHDHMFPWPLMSAGQGRLVHSFGANPYGPRACTLARIVCSERIRALNESGIWSQTNKSTLNGRSLSSNASLKS